jgi:hypothetical protein
MISLKNFMNFSAMIPWPLLVMGFKNDTLSFFLLGFQLLCFLTWIYLDKAEPED